MAKKRKGHEIMVYYGTAGSTAATHISANVTDVDPGIGGFDWVDRPDRGDGSGLPTQDEQPVKRNCQPTFSMEYHDGDTHMAALLAAVDTDPPTAKAFKFVRNSGGAAIVDADFYVEFSAPGPLAEGQVVEFTLHPTSDYGRIGLPTAS